MTKPKQAKLKHITIYTDGACKGNPGPGGWGAVLQYGKHVKELYGSEKETTNNRMEITAVIKALEAITTTCTIDIYTDSTYVRQGITQWIHNWKKNNWRTSTRKPVKNVDLWQMLESKLENHRIAWHWVKGHAGNIGNEKADMLATQGADEALSLPNSKL